jgi:hypothetical protein
MKSKAVTRKNAMLLQCWECMGHYKDGKMDCQNPKCPMYSYMPYREMEPDLSMFQYNPKWKGKATWEETTKVLSEEERQVLAERAKVSFSKGDK